mgnify:CR=1 FL=1
MPQKKQKEPEPKIFYYLKNNKHHPSIGNTRAIKKNLKAKHGIIKNVFVYMTDTATEEHITHVILQDEITKEVFDVLVNIIKEVYDDDDILFYYKSGKEPKSGAKKYTYSNLDFKRLTQPDEDEFRSDSDDEKEVLLRVAKLISDEDIAV